MKTKIVLSLAMAGFAFAAATNSARAGVSLDISIGSRSPRYSPPVVVAQRPAVVYSPAPVDNCAPDVASYPAYPGSVAVAPPPPQVIISHRVYGNYGRDYRHPDYRDQRRLAWRRDDDRNRRGRW